MRTQLISEAKKWLDVQRKNHPDAQVYVTGHVRKGPLANVETGEYPSAELARARVRTFSGTLILAVVTDGGEYYNLEMKGDKLIGDYFFSD